MRNPMRFSWVVLGAVPLCVGLALPATSFAAGGAANAAAGAKPSAAAAAKPDIQKKVWTNDDVERLNPAFNPNAPRGTQVAGAQPVAAARPLRPAPATIAPSAPVDPLEDPEWYAQQLAPLEDELASIDSREEQLRQFRASGATIPTAGLVLNAPCEGITTDNLIAQLDARRQEVAQEIDDLGDTARRNGMPPGILVEGRGRVELANQPTGEDLRASVVQQAREASDELAQIQDTIADIQDQLAAQEMSLQQPTPNNGGNMTTDLLDRMDSRASALRDQISDAEDAARVLGVPPGDLR
jgi:hypothetical protein